jgi:hypothetical protein
MFNFFAPLLKKKLFCPLSLENMKFYGDGLYIFLLTLVLLYQITILVAAEGETKIPSINGSGNLKEALQKLGSIPSSKLLVRSIIFCKSFSDVSTFF